MKLKYEEKLRLLQNMLTSAQKERDIALKKMNETEDDGKKEKTTDQKRKFEEKIRKLENEIAQLKQKYKNKDKTYSMSKNQNDNLIKNLKTNIENLKNEKNKLLQKMKMEVEKNRRIRFSNEQEIVGLKKREKEASMLAEKLEKNNQIQKALLKKKNEEALNSSKKIKSMMLLINKNKFQNEIINKRTKSSTALYQPRKSVSASTGSNLALYHSKSQSDSSKKKIISKVRTPLKSQEKNSKLLSLQVQWKKQSIDKEIEQFIINQELRMLYNDLLEKKINLELERKEILIKRNFGCKVDTSKEQLISTIENEKLDSIENEIKSIKGKIDKINQLNNIYNINENIHNNIVSYVGNFLKNMISENVQQLVKIYIKELVELRSNFIYSVFHSNIDSDSLDNLLMELKTAKKPYNLIKYYSKLMYPERYPSNLSFIKSDETMNKQGNSSGSVNQTFIDDDSQIMKDNKNSDHQTNDIIKRENSKNQFKMEDEYNRMLKSLESLYNIKLQEEMDDHDDNNGNHQNKRIYGSGDDVSRESHKELNENINKDEYNLDDYYFSNHKRNLSEQNAIIYSNMINSLQQKRNQQANTKREKQNETNKKLIHQRSRSLCDLKNIETDDCIRNSNDKLQNNRNNSKFNKPHIDNSNFNSSKVKTTKSFCSINDLLRKKETPLKKNYSEYISKQINSKVNNPKDDYEKTVNRLKCSITEKICNDIKKEIQDTYDIDISKKTGKTPKKLKYESSDSIKEKIYINH
ncbi:hypothetical protein BCR36DRAFT_179006 [Piromyces finnis]|uniref:Uncharacterized protein n=1 Tax=Piromyces finnis TaxID=1754191 RepID=A0A1Y1UUJ5_9FUNG|nr:hypothetical protein BCR36DRAFT_179006 [Piromyces finnis]|eukprot:ORX41637.1 hypothetical protein BCR36DRAFT_179006 [Piromyces finnis]